MIIVYYKKLMDRTFIYLLLYVDDILITCKDLSKINNLKAWLSKELEMKDLGAARKF